VLIGGSDALHQVPCTSLSPLAFLSAGISPPTRHGCLQLTAAGAAFNISGLVCICAGLIAYFWQLNRHKRAIKGGGEGAGEGGGGGGGWTTAPTFCVTEDR
jgi:hypothetical protein